MALVISCAFGWRTLWGGPLEKSYSYAARPGPDRHRRRAILGLRRSGATLAMDGVRRRCSGRVTWKGRVYS